MKTHSERFSSPWDDNVLSDRRNVSGNNPIRQASRNSNSRLRFSFLSRETHSFVDALLYNLIGFPVGLVWFVALVVLGSLSFGLMPVLFGIIVLTVTLRMVAGAANFERGLLESVLDEKIEPASRTPRTNDLVDWIMGPIGDSSYWREVLFLLLRFPFGLVGFVVSIIAISFPPTALSTVFWGWWVFGLSGTIIMLLAGVASLMLAQFVIRGVARMQCHLAHALLGPSTTQLSRRAVRAETRRDQSLEAAEAERRRIERDLHDGAQARLSTVALDLGRAKRKIEQGADTEEVVAAIDSAHRDAKEAIVELRNLARGIHPAVLTDRGLDAALSEVVTRCAVPIHLNVALARRPSAPIESAAYFAVSELVTNITNHSSARNAWINVEGTANTLTIAVSDDGVGGVDVGLGTGIAGLERRIEALGGSLSVDSPLGEGTNVLIELPATATTGDV